MSKEKYLITRLVNRKPISLNNIETIEKEGKVVLNYHETMISHIVEARENKEFEYICSEIQNFIERENIDICFVINKDELIDCLQEHQKLKLKITDLEAELASANDCANRYWKQLAIVENENDQLKQQLVEKDAEIERVKQEKTCYYNFGANCQKATIKTIDGREFYVVNDKGYQAIKELEKVKEFNHSLTLGGNYKIDDYIDQQIKLLKGESI